MSSNNIPIFNSNPYCPYCDKQMKYDEVYPYQQTSYKCDCEKWKKQEKLKLEINHTREKLYSLENELRDLQLSSLRCIQLNNIHNDLNKIKSHFATEDGYKWLGKG